MMQDKHFNRNRFLRDAGLTFAAAQLAMLAPANAGVNKLIGATVPALKRGTHTSFASLKHVKAGLLNVGYAEDGPPDGPVVMLLQGWPYDIYSYVDVAPLLAAQGFRVIVPFVRGCGSTTFLSSATPRNGEPAAIASDVIDFMDALKIDKAVFGAFDWGGTSANIIAAIWPQRCKALVSVSGYLVSSRAGYQQPLLPAAEHQWWYQFYFTTQRGALGYDKYKREFGKLIWQLASPKWDFDDATFDRTASSFDNPDYAAIVIHNYRWRLGLAEGERKYDEIEKQIDALPVISVPTITMEGDANGAPHDPAATYRDKYSGRYEYRLITGGVGHNLPQEAPLDFVKAIVDVSKL